MNRRKFFERFSYVLGGSLLLSKIKPKKNIQGSIGLMTSRRGFYGAPVGRHYKEIIADDIVGTTYTDSDHWVAL